MRLKPLIQIASTFLPWSIRKWVYRLLGATIERRAHVAMATILVADEIYLGADAQIDPLVMIYGVKELHMRAKSEIGFASMLTGHGAGSIYLGAFARIGTRNIINCSADVRLGSYTGTGPHNIIYTHGNYFPSIAGFSRIYEPVIIGDRSWLHLNVTVSPGVTIGNDVLVLTGTLVSHDIKSGVIYSNDAMFNKQDIVSEKLRSKPTKSFLHQWHTHSFAEFGDFLRRYRIPGDNEQLKEGLWQAHLNGREYVIQSQFKADSTVKTQNGSKPLIYLAYGIPVELRRQLHNQAWFDTRTLECSVVAYDSRYKPVMDFLRIEHGMPFKTEDPVDNRLDRNPWLEFESPDIIDLE